MGWMEKIMSGATSFGAKNRSEGDRFVSPDDSDADCLRKMVHSASAPHTAILRNQASDIARRMRPDCQRIMQDLEQLDATGVPDLVMFPLPLPLMNPANTQEAATRFLRWLNNDDLRTQRIIRHPYGLSSGSLGDATCIVMHKIDVDRLVQLARQQAGVDKAATIRSAS